MKPIIFKERFKKAQGEVPSGIDIELGKFRTFPKDKISNLNIDEIDKNILFEVGFPEDAAPFLSFSYDNIMVLENLNKIYSSLGTEYSAYKILGNNGSGDPICIDETNGEIVYFNHDFNMKKVFINSSLSKFAETLCLMAELIQSKYKLDFCSELTKVDKEALEAETMWSTEFLTLKEMEQ